MKVKRLVNKASVRAIVDKNMSSDFFEALELKVEELIMNAVVRAEGNQRKTVMGRDL